MHRSMSQRRWVARFVQLLVLVIGLSWGAGATGAAPAGRRGPTPFTYTVSMPSPHRHEFHVQLSVVDVPGDHVDLKMPKWNPGSYRLTGAHRNVRGVVARRHGSTRALPVEKLDEVTWRVHHGGKAFRMSYRVYADRYTGPRGAMLDDAFGFFDGVYVFMYAVGHKGRPINLRVRPFPGGRVVTGLPSRGTNVFRAADFDMLVDAPVQVGKIDVLRFRAGKVPYRMAMAGAGNYDAKTVTADVKKIVEAATAVFGGPPDAVPYSSYTFIYHLRPGAGGGLEHRNSTVIGSDPWIFDDPKRYRRFLSVTAHEFFHLWNVKRIRPAVLGPFAYDREVHTSMLWFSEGFTSYYAWVLLSRAGHRTEKQSLSKLAGEIRTLQTKPGRRALSVEQTSWETWLRPDDVGNSSYSYYNKGMLIGALIDLELRGATGGRKSLDGLYRELWARWRRDGRGLTRSGLEQAFLDYAAPEASDAVREIFTRYVEGTAEIDYDRYLAHAGYKLVVERKTDAGDLGVSIRDADGLARIERVVPGRAGDAGGLANGDVLLAIDGHRVRAREAERRIAALEPGTRHELTLFRGARLIRRAVRVAGGGKETYEVVSVDDPTSAQLAVRTAWLGLK